jgi:hypothetical protein
MSITLPKPDKLIPTIIKSRVPGWVLVAAVVAQFAINQATQPHEPSCELIYEYPHYSTSLQESFKQDAIKFNITSKCTENQTYTELIVTISKVSKGGQEIQFKSNLVQQDASKKDPTQAYFLEFWVPCKRGNFMNYISNAHGNVLLQSGRRVSVSNSIDKPLAILCEPKAK